MNIRIEIKKIEKITRFSFVVIFLALIRCIGEVFRLNYYAKNAFSYQEIYPFLIAALISAIALFIMTLFSFWSKQKPIIFIAILTIILLLVIKCLLL